ncbi:hypothetical protein BJX99DRAFT_233194 [Aspergillus californicus]
MATPSKREDIAKAFFNLDVSNIELSSTKSETLKPASRDSSSNLSVELTNKAEPKLTFLRLPAEIRLQIYDLLLVSRFSRDDPAWEVRDTYKKLVVLYMMQALGCRTIEPAVLRTCRQIYHESIPILYSRNVFASLAPEDMLAFMAQIGSGNINFVRTLKIWVPWGTEVLPWIRLLNTLSEKATGLRSIEVQWDAKREFPCQLRIGASGRGVGDNVDFARSLARIKCLEELKITGFYGQHWPSYFQKEMGVQVHTECGHPTKSLDEDDDEEVEWARYLNEENLQRFKAYQGGTENIFP